ncbi:hypothetical protein NDU88_001413 [Pleurodeles waltl]|uniref:Uncharacterized protein n=1 Tax=Pleurodeles waltl TaxID=8319 RepID=A0AAV7SCW3_PLEWA|nr:hypothetical protein NDU88_001413 [Pleurodeles waltl]
MAASVLLDYEYGGFLPQEAPNIFPKSSFSQSSLPEQSSSKSESDDSQRDSVPRIKKRKSQNVIPEAPAGKNLLFSSEDIVHPRSPSGFPRLRWLITYSLRSECPRLSLVRKVVDTPELDPSMATFLRKFAKDPKTGLDSACRGCQDKLLDLSGPLTKILDQAIQSKETNTPLDPEVVLEWAQQAICLLGNANCAMSTERRHSLIRLDTKLAEVAIN